MTKLTPVVAMTADGDYAACQSERGTVRVVGLADDDLDVTLRAYQGSLQVVGFRPGAGIELLVVDRAETSCTLVIWSPAGGFAPLPGRYPSSATVTWSTEGDCVVVDMTGREATVHHPAGSTLQTGSAA